MPPEPAFIIGLICGTIATLLIQWYGRRKVRQATLAPDLDARRGVELLDGENARRIGQIDRLQDRLATVERIVTDSAHGLDREIESLRAR
ncbi:hypothetical protein [Sphingomonas oligophenolica]|uniref:Uncharacterized protein n=1 Tax=Sphingomonas oligophenolica TaxID=301154 RepID=A0A502CHX0_9SPHN|nr:hypothetical protein [Sphingomonas oligophenolica]TPG12777.1 hypothetical protein EAH84_08410 [Sphingomonas oligophenolica]